MRSSQYRNVRPVTQERKKEQPEASQNQTVPEKRRRKSKWDEPSENPKAASTPLTPQICVVFHTAAGSWRGTNTTDLAFEFHSGSIFAHVGHLEFCGVVWFL